MVSTPLKNISQLGWLFPIWKSKKCSKPPTSHCSPPTIPILPAPVLGINKWNQPPLPGLNRGRSKDGAVPGTGDHPSVDKKHIAQGMLRKPEEYLSIRKFLQWNRHRMYCLVGDFQCNLPSSWELGPSTSPASPFWTWFSCVYTSFHPIFPIYGKTWLKNVDNKWPMKLPDLYLPRNDVDPGSLSNSCGLVDSATTPHAHRSLFGNSSNKSRLRGAQAPSLCFDFWFK